MHLNDKVELLQTDQLIRVAGGYIPTLDLCKADARILRLNLVQEVICPVAYYFNDNVVVRHILRISEVAEAQ